MFSNKIIDNLYLIVNLEIKKLIEEISKDFNIDQDLLLTLVSSEELKVI